MFKASHVKAVMFFTSQKACKIAEASGDAWLGLERLLFPEDPYLQGGACCAWSMVAAISQLDHAPLLMSEGDARFVADCFLESLRHWQGLCHVCLESNVSRWSFRPKHHYLEHISEQIRETRINARKLTCFQDESYLGRVKRIACKAHASNALLRVYNRLFLNLGQRFRESRS